MPDVTVWPHRAVKGWAGDEPPETYPVVSLREALTTEYSTDAHFVPYTLDPPESTVPRVNKSAISKLDELGVALVFGAAVVDVDCPEAHRGDGHASEDWRVDQEELYDALPDPLRDGCGVYHTRGGYRLLWELPEPLGRDAYLATVARLRTALAEHGIEADALVDWGRCYRLPHVVRDGVRQGDSGFDDLERLGDAPLGAEYIAAEGGRYDGIENADRARPALAAPEQITENRNTTLTRLAGQWRRTGLGETEILRMLEVVNDTRCVPPLEPDELANIARSMMRYAPEPPAPAGDDAAGGGPVQARPVLQLGDQVEVAGLVGTDLDADGERILCDRARLWRYDPVAGTWGELSEHAVRRQVHVYSGVLVQVGVDRDGNPRLRPLKVSSQFATGCLQVLQSERQREGWFDAAPAGLCFADQFVSVDDTGTVVALPLGPEHRQTDALPYAYRAGDFPMGFVSMLESCWKGQPDVDARIEALREWIGAALLGLTQQYQRALVLVGEGANGKSTVQEVVSALFPEGTVTSIPPQDMAQEYRRAALATARLNCVAELPEADILVSEPVKAMVSGDLLTARHIREAPFQFRPRCGHLFSANSLPAVRDMSHGFWRRWLVLPFERSFKSHEQDRGLARRLIATELGEIASWCVDGAAELVKRGHYDDPDSSVVSLAAWRADADQVSTFLDDQYARDDNDAVSASDVYLDYSVWAGSSGHRRMSRTKFGKRIKALGVSTRRTNKGVVYGLTRR